MAESQGHTRLHSTHVHRAPSRRSTHTLSLTKSFRFPVAGYLSAQDMHARPSIHTPGMYHNTLYSIRASESSMRAIDEGRRRCGQTIGRGTSKDKRAGRLRVGMHSCHAWEHLSATQRLDSSEDRRSTAQHCDQIHRGRQARLCRLFIGDLTPLYAFRAPT